MYNRDVVPHGRSQTRPHMRPPAASLMHNVYPYNTVVYNIVALQVPQIVCWERKASCSSIHVKIMAANDSNDSNNNLQRGTKPGPVRKFVSSFGVCQKV